jgi:hypothetical protein
VKSQGGKDNGHALKEPIPQKTARKVLSSSIKKEKSSIEPRPTFNFSVTESVDRLTAYAKICIDN